MSTESGALEVSAVSCAFDEAASLPQLLEGLFSSRGERFLLREVIVQWSGSTDQTERILRDVGEREPRVVSLGGPTRLGKVESLKKALEQARGEVILVENADTVPAPGMLEAIAEKFLTSDAEIVCCHPIPVENGRGLVGLVGQTLWTIHDAVSRLSPKPGEAYAIRRSVLHRFARATEDDDNMLSTLAHAKILKAEYAPDAVLWMKSPEGLGDYVRQRVRVSGQTARAWRRGEGVPGTWDPAVVAPALFRVRHGDRRIGLLPLAVFVGLEFLVRGWCVLESILVNRPQPRWPMIGSTKGPIHAKR
ncbi:MAG: glycosyltransferase [Thermoplasmata archaeon]